MVLYVEAKLQDLEEIYKSLMKIPAPATEEVPRQPTENGHATDKMTAPIFYLAAIHYLCPRFCRQPVTGGSTTFRFSRAGLLPGRQKKNRRSLSPSTNTSSLSEKKLWYQ